jgi:hypothetical protein
VDTVRKSLAELRGVDTIIEVNNGSGVRVYWLKCHRVLRN